MKVKGGDMNASVTSSSGEDGSYARGAYSISDDGDSAFGTSKSSHSFTLHTDDGDSSFGSLSTKHKKKKANQYVDPIVAEREGQFQLYAKIAVSLVILVAMVVVAVTLHLMIKSNERANFEAQFVNYASEVISVAQQNTQSAFEAVESKAYGISSMAYNFNMKWPFVTIPNFAQRFQRLLVTTKSTVINFAPLVPEGPIRKEWVNYTDMEMRDYIENSIAVEGIDETYDSMIEKDMIEVDIFNRTSKGINVIEQRPKKYVYAAIWQRIPLVHRTGVTVTRRNIMAGPRARRAYNLASRTRAASVDFAARFNQKTNRTDVISQIMQPIYENPNLQPNDVENNPIVGVVQVTMDWKLYFENILPKNAEGIYVVIDSSCQAVDSGGNIQVQDTITYQINGPKSTLVGQGDLHEEEYDHLVLEDELFQIHLPPNITVPDDVCLAQMTLRVYPSKELQDSVETSEATLYTIGVVVIFLFASCVFAIYDWTVRNRQAKFMKQIIKQDKIVLNMFPKEIRDKLYAGRGGQGGGGGSVSGPHHDLEGFSVGGLEEGEYFSSSGPPLADLYLEVTVMFADISGFTAWSSAREPNQVFILLETIYGAFDVIAGQLGVFKVETVGDCYVACAGLPDPRQDHAVVIAKFARRCLLKMQQVTRKLEVSLGPDTADMSLRVGIHSGQVTAGVLRGERSRYQLFGDTVNTTARMESTSSSNRIQVSPVTADLLMKSGKQGWLRPREDTVKVKGKGQMRTYWLKAGRPRPMKATTSIDGDPAMESIAELGDGKEGGDGSMQLFSPDESEAVDDDDELLGVAFEDDDMMSKMDRLVEWNVNVLSELLQQILAARKKATERRPGSTIRAIEQEILGRRRTHDTTGPTVLDEFQEIISLPKLNSTDLKNRKDPHTITLDPVVVGQLRDVIKTWSKMYRDNHFHNFEHASHVTASVCKLLTRIVKVDTGSADDEEKELVDLAGHSYGITSDPLTQFAVVMSAIIHDLDHPGIPNSQCVKENVHKADIYKKSIAEQNSVDLAWDVLMDPQFAELRACIYSNEDELRRFRQLVVNAVMATDIVDNELQALRKARWEVAFSETHVDPSPELAMNRKATIVIEHLIQASDVAHMMQHFKVYRLWNEKFFRECYGAYKEGRAEKDPSVGWYKGEIGFFKFYVIPLTKKLENCGVFGVSSHEYLAYAESNCEEWERDGEKIVAEYIENYNKLNQQEQPLSC